MEDIMTETVITIPDIHERHTEESILRWIIIGIDKKTWTLCTLLSSAETTKEFCCIIFLNNFSFVFIFNDCWQCDFLVVTGFDALTYASGFYLLMLEGKGFWYLFKEVPPGNWQPLWSYNKCIVLKLWSLRQCRYAIWK